MKELSPKMHQTLRPTPLVLREEAPTVLSRPMGGGAEVVDVYRYWCILRKHIWVIAVAFFGAIAAGGVYVLTRPPLYTATAKLLVERQAPQILPIQGILPEIHTGDKYDYYKTQYEILRSRSLAAQVIQQQQLTEHPLFTDPVYQTGLLTGLWSKAKAWADSDHVEDVPVPQAPAADPFGMTDAGDFRRDPTAPPFGIASRFIDTYMKFLTIRPVRNTQLVQIAFRTPDPVLSAHLANTHARAYIRHGLTLSSQASGEAKRFLEEKLVELKERLQQSDAALNRYRREKKIISLDAAENVVVTRLADLNQRLTEAEAERIAFEAQVYLIRSRDYSSLPEVISSTLIQTLKEQLAGIEGEYAQLSAQFKPGYPRLNHLQAQVEETRRRLGQEIQKVVAGIQSTYLAAVARENELRATLERQKSATLQLKDTSVGYAILAREVDTNRQLYDNVLQRMKEMGVSAELRASNVSVIDRAEQPRIPSSPNKKRGLLFSGLLGLMGGVGFAFFLEFLDNSFRTPQEVEQYLHLPSLGVIPDFLSFNETTQEPPATQEKGERTGLGQRDKSSLKLKKPQPAASLPARKEGKKELVLAHHPLSVVTESYRAVRTAILFARAGQAPKTMLFTGATRGEGKTATTVNTAVIFAQMGARVLVVDGDLRRPRCHRILGLRNGLGMSDFLTGQRELHEVIKPTPTEGLFLISRGAAAPNPAELLGSHKMAAGLEILQEQFDYILIDSPPVMLVNDAVLLSTLVDGVVLVVDGQNTPKKVVREACGRLQAVRAKILGVILNRVDVRTGDYAYQYGQYYSYYGDAGDADGKAFG